MKRLLLSVALLLACTAHAVTLPSITLNPGDSVNVSAPTATGTPPPGTVTCSDGTVHTLPYTCPPPAVEGACPGFAKTLRIPLNWANPTRMLTAAFGGFNADDIVVLEFTTGNGASAANNLPRIAGAEYAAGAATRVAVMSETACDFVGLSAPAAHVTSSAITMPFNVLTPDMWGGFYPVLALNKRYFVNIKNAQGSGCTATCDMFFDLSKNGTP